MANFSLTGAEWIGQRIGFAVNGIIGATAFFLLDWLLPRWFKNIYITYDYLHRARSIDRSMNALFHSAPARLAYFAVPLLCVVLFRIWLVPTGREILFHHGLIGYTLLLGIATIQYLISDGTPDERRLSMFAHRDAALLYLGTGYSLVYRWWVWSLMCSGFNWVVLPSACLSGGIWMLWNRIPEAVRLAPLRMLAKAGPLFMKTWDLCDMLEALLVERLPKWLQYKLHRYQQQRRKHVPAYVYSPLKPGEIRILRLQKTRWWLPGSVEADLIHVPMYPPPEYEAVSYRWGSSERTESIVLDGSTTFAITRSAYDLLILRRSLWRVRTIWIDAICINQSDETEKAAQVQLMREIYHHASRVVICPGGNWTARVAAHLLYETLAATYQFSDTILGLNKLTSAEKLSTKWKALKELLLNEYFTRAWVVQEVAVGKKVELYYGGLYIDWNVFFQLAMHLAHPHRREMLTLGDRKDRSFLGTSSLENIAIMEFLRADSTAFGDDVSERTGLDAVLFSTFTFRATDPRDKVFAVLGIARFEDPEGLLVPDYSKSVTQVWRDAAEHLFFCNGGKASVHMLGLAGTGHSHARLPMPSWVPNLNQEYLWFPFTDFMNLEGTFRASEELSTSEYWKGSIPDSLAIKGIVCDTILLLGITTVHEGELQPSGQQDATYVTRQKHAIVTDVASLIQKYREMFPDRTDGVDTQIWLALVAGRIDRKRPSAGTNWNKVFGSWVGILDRLEETDDRQSLRARFNQEGANDPNSDDVEEADIITYDSAIEGCYGRRFAISQQGRLCWVPPFAETDDDIFVPCGAQTPFLVRAKGEMEGQDVYELVGESYIQGLMWGELLESDHQESVITLV